MLHRSVTDLASSLTLIGGQRDTFGFGYYEDVTTPPVVQRAIRRETEAREWLNGQPAIPVTLSGRDARPAMSYGVATLGVVGLIVTGNLAVDASPVGTEAMIARPGAYGIAVDAPTTTVVRNRPNFDSFVEIPSVPYPIAPYRASNVHRSVDKTVTAIMSLVSDEDDIASVESASHSFVADLSEEGITEFVELMQAEPADWVKALRADMIQRGLLR